MKCIGVKGKLLAGILFLGGLVLGGCGKTTEETMEQADENSTIVLYDWIGNTATVIDMTSPAECSGQYELPENTQFVRADEEMIYYTTADYWDGKYLYQICALNRTTGEVTIIKEKASEREHIFSLETADKQIYVGWSCNQEDTKMEYYEEVYAIGDDGITCRRLYNEMYRAIGEQNYRLINGIAPEYCLQKFGEVYAENYEEEKIGIFDETGNCKEIFDEQDDFGNLYYAAGEYFIYSQENTGNYVIYNRTTSEKKLLEGEGLSLMSYDEGCVYYCITEEISYNVAKRTAYQYEIETDTTRMLYEVSDLAGDIRSKSAGTGFQVAGEYCYFIGSDGVDGAWRVFDPAKNEVKEVDGAEPLWHCSYADYGTAEGGSEIAVCPFCQKEIYCVYTEQFVLDERYPNADRINEYLQEKNEEVLNNVRNEEEITEENDWHLDEGFRAETNKIVIQSVQEVGAHYLQVEYDGYWDGGGAHGMPYRNYYLFDLDTGERVLFTDLYEGTEEAFKQLAAEYTVLDWKEDSRNYFAQSEEAVYSDAYSCVSTDMDIKFGEDGVSVIYDPYLMGSYATGFIEVEIPYEALELKECFAK